MSDKKIVIIGAGPAGLGAAYRLHKLGYRNWKIYEKESYVGGLSASFKDSNGFLWDQGGHVAFSHYDYFDEIFDFSCGDDFFLHDRNAYAFMEKKLVPYPVQNNIRYLSKETVFQCVMGLINRKNSCPKNFQQWLKQNFGDGLCDCFLYPYNKKVWQTDLKKMGFNWIAERVSVIKLETIVKNIIFGNDDISWGPNNRFKFPKYGATQGIFSPVADLVSDRLALNAELESLDLKNKTIHFSNGQTQAYDFLISTIPIDDLIHRVIDSEKIDKLISQADRLIYNSVLVTGLGFLKKNNDNKCWIYFPEKSYPWYRVTYFSNYSNNNVPSNGHFSLMGEVGFPVGAQPDGQVYLDRSLDAYVKCGFISGDEEVVSRYHKLIPKAYPVPSIERDDILKVLQGFLMDNDIYSRGRFGGWKYEVANMDHCVMQGKEAVDSILNGEPETVYGYVR